MNKLKAPFPYFGGKSMIADRIWALLGNPDHYLEPFFGSGAVLLSRKNWQGKTETVNDKDGFLANVWRSIQFSPDEVARWCDWPVNHADLSARREKLISEEQNLLKNLIDDPEWCNPKLAGYWIWGMSCWIGKGFTGKSGYDRIPSISRHSIGINQVGVQSQRPHLSDTGCGVHRVWQIPQIDSAAEINRNTYIYEWLNDLSRRLRRVRVVCGDWSRICGGNWQSGCGGPIVGYYFDPPYGVRDRSDCYHCDSRHVAADVMAWCAEKGKRKNWRIVLSGYEEYQKLADDYGWGYESWKTNGGYSNQSSRGNENRYRERLYFSPGCLRQEQIELF